MSTFWRTELRRQIADHQRAGHLIDGRGPGLDPAHLDAHFWKVVEKASQESRAHGALEFAEETHQLAVRHREQEVKRYVAGVLARHRAEVEQREAADIRRRQTRLRLALFARDMTPLKNTTR